MHKSLRLSAVVFAASLAAISGCRCDDGQQTRSLGEVRVVFTDESGATLTGESGVYDFGQVPMGKVEKMPLVVTNTGLGILTLNSFTKVEGSPIVALPGVTDVEPVFEVSLGDAVPVELGSGATEDFDISFTPPVSATERQVSWRAVVQLHAGNTEEGKDVAQIEIRGVAVSGTCDLPDEIDFGAVARGDTMNQTLVFDNTQPIDTVAFVGDVSSQQGAVFALTPESPRGEFTILAGREKNVTITFAPTENRLYQGSVRLRKAEGCPEKEVRLVGTGVDSVLSWDPTVLDFGFSPPGYEVEREVTFLNAGLREVKVTDLRTMEGSTPSMVFRVVSTSGGDSASVTVPPAARDPDTREMVSGSATVTVGFKPYGLGATRASTLSAKTDLRNQTAIAVPLRGAGGGPDIEVRPAPVLNFGRIAYFPTASPPSFASRKLTVHNVGTSDVAAALKLGQADSSAPGGFKAPYWEITPSNAESSLDEICIGSVDASGACLNSLPTAGVGKYDPQVGIVALGSSAFLDIPVRVTPNNLGAKEWEVKMYSNDPDEPVTTITIQANAVELPPCNAQVTPVNLNFGVVSPPMTKDLGFQIRNLGTQASEVCLITSVQMQSETGTPSGMQPIFSLPAGELDEAELMPGETLQVLVRAWPQGQMPATAANVTGKVQFNVSNPNTPQATVSLAATIAPSCLTISPSDLDFGTVQKDCNSPDRTFSIYNTCATSISITSFAMAAAAGEPAGGPNCPGTSACPEFVATSTPTTPLTITAGQRGPDFKLKYRPINYGADTGSFVVKANQGGQLVDYVVTLRGTGDTMGLNTDTFRQDSKPKADILLVVDDSCSMSDKQDALAANFSSFMQYAVSSQVDFQIGVTTTDFTPAVNGRLKATGAGNKILKPTTPNLSTEFDSLVHVGINGSATESCSVPAVTALTAPLITDPAANLGLLRPDAVLAVVCVTDEPDQAPQPPVYYLNQLLNIKGAQRPGMFTYNAVGPFGLAPPSGCYADSDTGEMAYMVSATNGVKEDICTPNWALALENIGKNAFGFRTNFFLTSQPDLASTLGITVAIDGVTLDPTDARGAKVWEFDPTTQSINFEPLYVPEPGKTLTVTYQVACIP